MKIGSVIRARPYLNGTDHYPVTVDIRLKLNSEGAFPWLLKMLETFFKGYFKGRYFKIEAVTYFPDER